MTTSEQIDQLAAALAQAQGQIKGAVKDSANPFFKSRYADLASVWEACRAALSANGLAVLQFPRTEYTGEPEIYEWTSRTGETRTGVRVKCTVSVLTRLTHCSGQWAEDVVSAMLASADPQAIGSAVTYLRRYALQSVVGVAPEDDDGEAAQGRQVTAPRVQQDPEPTGYRQWLDDMTAVADEGTQALELAWKGSKVEYRSHLTRTNKAHWEQLKIKAQEASVLRTEL